jgi:hypothetical protein
VPMTSTGLPSAWNVEVECKSAACDLYPGWYVYNAYHFV